MEFKPKLPTFRTIRRNLAIVFGVYGAIRLWHYDINNGLSDGLWSFGVCLALILGILPEWLTGRQDADKTVKPEKYSLFSQ